MTTIDSQSMEDESDPLIDDIRAIRCAICESNGHDIDRIVEELRQVERDYIARRGVFSVVTTEAAEKVETSWGNVQRSDP